MANESKPCRYLAVLFLLGYALLVGGCGDKSSSTDPMTVDTAATTVSGIDGAAVAVAAESLDGPVTIRIARDSGGAPELPQDSSPAGSIYALTPHGITFARPVAVRIPFDPSTKPDPEAIPMLFKAAPGGHWMALAGASLDGNSMVADVLSFSYFNVQWCHTVYSHYSSHLECAFAGRDVTLSVVSPTPAPPPAGPPGILQPVDLTMQVIRPTLLVMRVTVQARDTADFPTHTMQYQVISEAGAVIASGSFSSDELNASPEGKTIDVSTALTESMNGLHSYHIELFCTNIGYGCTGRAIQGFNPEVPPYHLSSAPVLLNVAIPPGTAPDPASLPLFDSVNSGFVLPPNSGGGFTNDWTNPLGSGPSQYIQLRASSVQPLTHRWEISLDGGVSWVNFELGPDYIGGVVPECHDDWLFGTVCIPETNGAIPAVADNVQVTERTICVDFPAGSCNNQWPHFPSTSIDGLKFRVVVSNAFGSVTGPTWTISASQIGEPPAITSQPSGIRVVSGETASFTVVTSGVPTPTYQWERLTPGDTWQEIAAATSATYTTPILAPVDSSTNYRVKVINVEGSVTSNPAALIVDSGSVAPFITAQPLDLNVIVGSEATFAVNVDGSAPLSFQWQRDGVDIVAANEPMLKLPAVSTGDAANYAVVISNPAGSVVSRGASLTVVNEGTAETPPVIATAPADMHVLVGETASFAVGVSGTSPLFYQWNKDGLSIDGATQSVFAIANAALGDAGVYSVTVSNAQGSIVSQGATLTVIEGGSNVMLPVVVTEPAAITAYEGQSASFAVGVTGGAPLSYQWFRNGVPIPGATTAVYTIASVAQGDAGDYSVTVSNTLGSADSVAATLNVIAVAGPVAPSIISPPVATSVVEGDTAFFAVVATGSDLRYQWLKNLLPIDGATGNSYTTAPVTLVNDGDRYSVLVYNTVNAVFSDPVGLSVVSAAAMPVILPATPADTSIFEGGTASFGVTLSAGSEPLSYQWYRNGQPIDGATGSSYSLSPVSLTDDGALFSVEVSNSEGVVASREATLSVQPLATPVSFGNWSLQRPLPHANQLEALAVFNGTLFAAGERVTQFSSDQGQTWSPNFNQIRRITDIAAPAAGVLLVARPDNGSGAYGVYRSTDNGQTLTQTINDSVLSIAFADSSQGIAINAYSSSYQTTIYHTSDGGQTWTLSQLPVEYLNKVVAVAPDNYVMVGSAYGLILRSTDGGQNWIEVNNTGVPFDVLSDVAFADASIGIAVIDNGSTLLRTIDGGANWSSVAAPAHAYQVAFADTSHAVIVSQSGQTYYSTDGGQTWEIGESLNFQGGENISQVIFADANTGYAVGSRGQVFRTTDTGLSWGLVAGGSNQQDNYSIAASAAGTALIGNLNSSLLSNDGGSSWTDTGQNCFYSAFADNNVVVCAAYDNLYRSDDAGNSWSDVFNQPTTVQRHIAFANANTGIAVGGAGEILRTSDGGVNWSPVASGISTDLWTAGFVSSTAGYVGGPGATSAQVTLLRTSDAGASWTPLSLPVTGAQYGVYAIASPSVGVDLVATAWQIFRSTDGGQNWTLVTDVDADSLCSSGLQAMAFTDATHGLAVGGSGCMLRTTDAGATWARVDLPITADYNAVTAVDSDSFVVVGAGGLILRNGLDGAP